MPAKAPGVTAGSVLGGIVFILSMGATFNGDAHPVVEPREYEIVPYKDKAPGFQNHHGVLDRWASANVPGYVSRAPDSPTIRLSRAHHDATRKVYPTWAAEWRRNTGQALDWTAVSPREILDLSERQFNEAEVPSAAREAYYRAFIEYIHQEK